MAKDAQSDAFDVVVTETPSFPTLAPLDHHLDRLSPRSHPEFDVDQFLLSRTKASDLNYILKDLRTYSDGLKQELVSIINDDYKDFVSLGSGLKAEAHRIARLGWSTSSDPNAPSGGGMAPVRQALVQSRDTLHHVQAEINDCIKRREEASARKARLELMLQLYDSVTRLEELLLIPSSRHRRSSQARVDEHPFDSASDDHASDYGLSSDFDHDDELEQDQDDYLSILSSTTSPKATLAVLAQDSGAFNKSPSPIEPSSSSPKAERRKKRRRQIAPRTSSGASPSASKSPTNTFLSIDHTGINRKARQPDENTASSLLGLPQRVARTSAEFSRLRFLSKRVKEEGLLGFSSAVQVRMEHIRTTLRQDLRALLKALLSPSSLLVRGQPTETISRKRKTSSAPLRRQGSVKSQDELEAWSQVAPPAEDGEAEYWNDRLQEQREWLEMVLATLVSLGQTQEKDERQVREAEEAVRQVMIQNWANETITASSLQSDPLPLPSIEHLSASTRERIQAVLLSDEPSPLQSLFNRILHYTATSAWHVTDAGEIISSREDGRQQCDIFVNVLWDEIVTCLMDELGGTLFFVGRPDVFYKNYTTTNLFLERFASLAPSKQAHTALLRHPSWSALKKRWQLAVYFQMRFREIINKLEQELDSGSQVLVGKMQATISTLQAIRAPWQAGVHLHELSAREWRVVLQVLSRYKTWVESEIPDDVTRSVAEDEGTLRHIIMLVADLQFLVDSVGEIFEKEIRPKLNADDELVELLKATLEDSVSYRHALTSSLGRNVTSHLIARCTEPLRMLRSLSTTYRAVPSPFISQLLSPLSSLPPLPHPWTVQILTDLTSRYTTSLTTINQNHESLKRLKRGVTSLFTASSDSDDKIRKQMQTDVNAFLSSVSSLGIKDFDSWECCKNLLAAAEGSTD